MARQTAEERRRAAEHREEERLVHSGHDEESVGSFQLTRGLIKALEWPRKSRGKRKK